MKQFHFTFFKGYLNNILREIKFSEARYKVVDNTVIDKNGKPVIRIEQGVVYYDMELKELKRLLRV